MAGSVAVRSPRVPDIRKGDEVVVLTGKDAGKRGTVDRVIRDPQGHRRLKTKYSSEWKRVSPLAGVAVVVEGINIAKRHTKPRARQGRNDRAPRVQQGGIIEIARPIHASNVMIVCPSCSRPTRVSHNVSGSGQTVRVCRHCGEPLARAEGRA
jgi:large subunit ribosomal protein L24